MHRNSLVQLIPNRFLLWLFFSLFFAFFHRGSLTGLVQDREPVFQAPNQGRKDPVTSRHVTSSSRSSRRSSSSGNILNNPIHPTPKAKSLNTSRAENGS